MRTINAIVTDDGHMQQEQRGEYAKAEEVYDEVLKTNSANALVMKRKIAVLKAQKKTHDAIAALNDFVRSFQTDQAAVRFSCCASSFF